MELELTLVDSDAPAGLPVSFDDFAGSIAGLDPFATPYESSLCFDALYDRIKGFSAGGDPGTRFLATEVLSRLEGHGELRGAIKDAQVLKRHSELFNLLLLFLIAPVERTTGLIKLSRPFAMHPIYASPSLREMMGQKDACYSFGAGAGEIARRHLINIGCIILQQCYGVAIDVTVQAMLTVPDPTTKLKRFYKPVVQEGFIKVIVEGSLPALSQQQIQELLDNVHDTDLWLRRLPPEVFSFHGFHLAQLHEVTIEESMSRLKHRLISRDAVLDVARVQELADLLRLHFQMPDLRLGLTALDYPADRAIDHEYRIRYNLLADTVPNLVVPDFAGSVYHEVFRSGEMLVVGNLAERAGNSPLEARLLELGYRSMLLAPLLDQEQHVIGLVELASPRPYALHAFLETRFQEIRGLFRTAVERSREYIDNRIEAIMREQYTSLHPSVEWRFTQAAFNILQRQEQGLPPVADEIRFRKVYPLYGQADIVGSSQLRNTAIYQDLFDNLRAGRYFLEQALASVDFPIVSQVIMSLDQHLLTELEEFNNSHEVKIGQFIHKQLTPLVRQLGADVPELTLLAGDYFAKLDRELGLYYRVRRDYEQSVNALNRSIGDFLTERDQITQRILPHYFEKYKTDGVEYELYAGKSLLKQQDFSDIHLKNLRLSQLIDLCDLTRRVATLSETLPMPLRTAQLVFAYTDPLDIRFRMDEKHFDVDGDYNIRYEILKKRIDKATIDRGQERLTQAGTISIVYLKDSDLDEYQDYLDYLKGAGYLDGDLEYLTIDPLQSVNGLRALRFRVSSSPTTRIATLGK